MMGHFDIVRFHVTHLRLWKEKTNPPPPQPPPKIHCKPSSYHLDHQFNQHYLRIIVPNDKEIICKVKYICNMLKNIDRLIARVSGTHSR